MHENFLYHNNQLLLFSVPLAGIASFQPKAKGAYTVEVKQDGKAIAGSPFKINIDDHHICNPHKVKIAGAFKEATANMWNEVTLNIEEAGQFGPTCRLYSLDRNPQR